MKYMLLIYTDPPRARADPADGREDDGRVHRVHPGDHRAPVSSSPATPLQGNETATTVRVRDGKTTTTDGPFAETKEHLGGYYIVDVKDLDRALELAAQIPDARTGAIEVRPVLEIARRAVRRRVAGHGDRRRRAIAGLPRGVGPGPGHADPRPRRLRPRRGRAAGGASSRRSSAGPSTACPTRPGAWLLTAARRKAIDRIRREAKRDASSEPRARAARGRRRTRGPRRWTMSAIADDRLRLIFTCCHPALAHRRPGRAHPAHARRPDHRRDRPRVPGARGDDGAAPGAGEAQDPHGRHPLPGAAGPRAARPAPRGARRRLPDLQRGLPATAGDASCAASCAPRRSASAGCSPSSCPTSPRSTGLLALMLLHDARRDDAGRRRRRPGPARRPGPQRWDHGADRRRDRPGRARRCARRPARCPGPYQVQAAIAAVHAEAPTAEPTPTGAQIAALYGELRRVHPSPVVELNRAVAVAMADGPLRGLELLDRLRDDGALEDNHLFHAARADLLFRLGRVDEATAAYAAGARPGDDDGRASVPGAPARRGRRDLSPAGGLLGQPRVDEACGRC